MQNNTIKVLIFKEHHKYMQNVMQNRSFFKGLLGTQKTYFKLSYVWLWKLKKEK